MLVKDDAVPDADVTVPALHVAVVGAAEHPYPRAVEHVAPTSVLAVTSVHVAVPEHESLNDVRLTVWPMLPTTAHPVVDAVETDPSPVAVQLYAMPNVCAKVAIVVGPET